MALHPKEFQRLEAIQDDIIEAAEAKKSCLFDRAQEHPVPKKLRPATPSDVVEGAIFWMPHWDNGKWCIVEEVLNPNSALKAFVWLGCRYGIESAFVEVD